MTDGPFKVHTTDTLTAGHILSVKAGNRLVNVQVAPDGAVRVYDGVTGREFMTEAAWRRQRSRGETR